MWKIQGMRQRGALGITENQGVRIAFHLQTAEVADFVSSDLSSPHHTPCWQVLPILLGRLFEG